MDVGLIYRKAFLILDEYKSKFFRWNADLDAFSVREVSVENLECEERIEVDVGSAKRNHRASKSFNLDSTIKQDLLSISTNFTILIHEL